MYRINYGNGQVSRSFYTKSAVFAEYSATVSGRLYAEFASVEKRIAPGEWRKVRA